MIPTKAYGMYQAINIVCGFPIAQTIDAQIGAILALCLGINGDQVVTLKTYLQS